MKCYRAGYIGTYSSERGVRGYIYTYSFESQDGTACSFKQVKDMVRRGKAMVNNINDVNKSVKGWYDLGLC